MGIAARLGMGLACCGWRRRGHSIEVEFDADVLTRANMLERYQAYRIAREIGLNSANELRRFENMNPRTDPGGDEFLAPMNMQGEQTGAEASSMKPLISEMLPWPSRAGQGALKAAGILCDRFSVQ